MMPLLKRLWLLLLFPIALQAQTNPGVLEAYSTSRGGGVHHVLAKGGFLFAAEGSSLVVYDTREAVYQRSFERRFASPITDMVLHGGFLYIAANYDGLSKWDINIPIKPALVAEYKPTDFVTAIQSIDFKGDTVVLAASSSVLLLRERTGMVQGFDRVGRIAEQVEGYGRIGCGTVMGNYYAAAVVGKDRGVGQGIHTYRIEPEARLNFHHYDSAEPGKLLLLASAHRLLVFGGPTFATQSHLMGLNVADPAHPALYLCDTVRGARGLASVQGGFLIGDTLLVPFAGKLGPDCEASNAGIAVYSIKDPAHLRLLGQIPLTHPALEVACAGNRLHVAAGAVGIVSYDWASRKLQGCIAPTAVARSRSTGGFCTGADAMGDKLLTADGEAGFTMHLIQDRKTIATHTYSDLGSIDQVRFLEDGLHAACWVRAAVGDSVVVVRLDDGKVVGSVSGAYGHHLVVQWRDRFVCAREDHTGFDILNLHTPAKCKKEQSVLLNFNNLGMDDLGKLIVTTEHNVRIYDMGLGGLVDLVTYSKWGEGFGAATGEAGIIYVCSSKRGLIRFKIFKDKNGFSTLKEDLVWKLPQYNPQKMVLDAKGLYLGYESYGIYALDKNKFETTGYYRTGLDFKGRTSEGLQDLFCRNGKIYLAEYYGQVTILRRTDVED